jgi:hypothetical protein
VINEGYSTISASKNHSSTISAQYLSFSIGGMIELTAKNMPVLNFISLIVSTRLTPGTQKK